MSTGCNCTREIYYKYWFSVGSNCSQGSYYVQGLRAARLSTVVIRVGSIIIQVPDGLDSTLVISFISISYIYTSNSPCSKLQAPKSVTSLFFIFRPKSDKSIGLGQDFRFFIMYCIVNLK